MIRKHGFSKHGFRKLLLTVALLSCSLPAFAAPFLICDPPPAAEGVTHYDIVRSAGATPIRTPAPLKYDMVTTPVGPISFQIRAVRVDPIWGDATSAYVPFVDARPSAPSSSAGLRLSAN